LAIGIYEVLRFPETSFVLWLLEEECEEFSNIAGLGQIRFARGNIRAVFEQIREVLEREGVLGADTPPWELSNSVGSDMAEIDG